MAVSEKTYFLTVITTDVGPLKITLVMSSLHFDLDDSHAREMYLIMVPLVHPILTHVLVSFVDK